MIYPVGSLPYTCKLYEQNAGKIPQQTAERLLYPLVNPAVEVSISKEARELYEANIIHTTLRNQLNNG